LEPEAGASDAEADSAEVEDVDSRRLKGGISSPG
jgi:hypothetical protein